MCRISSAEMHYASLLCVEDAAIDRPTMLEMLNMLTNESTPLLCLKNQHFLSEEKQLRQILLIKSLNFIP